MFGFSFGKLLLLAVVFIVLYGIFRAGQGRSGQRPPVPPPQAADRPAELLERCPVCGVYGAQSRTACPRGDCPYLRRPS